jgi:hypothetical protein
VLLGLQDRRPVETQTEAPAVRWGFSLLDDRPLTYL